jgi:hypothetical protein
MRAPVPAECNNNCAHNGYIRTVTGSYHRGVGTTFIDDALLQFYSSALNTPGGLPRPSAPAAEAAAAATVTFPGTRAGWADHPERPIQTKTRSAARMATRQKRYDESTFSARLAEALQQHRMAVRTAHTSSSVMRDITDQLARFASKQGKDSSNEDIPAWHGPCGPKRPPRH